MRPPKQNVTIAEFVWGDSFTPEIRAELLEEIRASPDGDPDYVWSSDDQLYLKWLRS